jgi:hypothetical protein
MQYEFESEVHPIKLSVKAFRINNNAKGYQKTRPFVTFLVNKLKFYWIVEGKFVIPRDPDNCKRRELEWFS